MKAWPVAIIGFFLVVAGVNIYFVTLAYQTNHGLVVENPYEQGLVYEAEMVRLAAAKKLGVQPSLRLIDGGVEVSFPGWVLEDGLSAELSLTRPSDASLDRKGLALMRIGEVLRAKTDITHSGLWLYRLSVSIGGTDYLWQNKVRL